MLLNRGLITLVVSLIAVLLFAQVSHATGFQPISQEELKMTSEPKAPGAPAVILFRQDDCDDNGLTSHENQYYRIKILTEAGRDRANVEIRFDKEESVVNVKGRTIEPDGSIVNFDGKVFEKEVVKARGFKYRAKTFTLPNVQVGSIIEYYFTLDLEEYWYFQPSWILSEELFTRQARFSLKPYMRSYVAPRILHWSWNWLPAGAEAPKQGPDKVISLEVHDVPAFQEEDFMPPEKELMSRVDFIYTEDMSELNPDKFWNKTGKRMNDSLEKFIGKRSAMAQAVSQIVSPSDSPETKARKIYDRVQQLRNTSYEIQKTEQEKKREKEKDLANVEEVWKRGYGSGVQLTWLYLALVRAAGIEAYGVWASDRSNYFFDRKMQDPSRLDANVVLVKLDGKDVYCDPGAAFTPFGLLPWTETHVAGLRMDKDGGSWILTSLPDSSASRIIHKANLKLSDTGDLEGMVEVTFSGLEASQRRVEEKNQDETARIKFLEDAMKESIPAAAEVELINKPDWSASTPTLVAEFKIKVTGWATGAGRRSLVPVGLFSAQEKRVFEHANRVHPIYMRYPFEILDDVNVELPSGWQVGSLPPAKEQPGHVVAYTLKIENNQGRVHLSRDLSVNFVLLETKYYPALRNFFQYVKAGDEEQIVLQPGTASASK